MANMAIHDANGEFIGVGQLGSEASLIEDYLLAQVEAGSVAYVMEATTNELVFSTEPGSHVYNPLAELGPRAYCSTTLRYTASIHFVSPATQERLKTLPGVDSSSGRSSVTTRSSQGRP